MKQEQSQKNSSKLNEEESINPHHTDSTSFWNRHRKTIQLTSSLLVGIIIIAAVSTSILIKPSNSTLFWEKIKAVHTDGLGYEVRIPPGYVTGFTGNQYFYSNPQSLAREYRHRICNKGPGNYFEIAHYYDINNKALDKRINNLISNEHPETRIIATGDRNRVRKYAWFDRISWNSAYKSYIPSGRGFYSITAYDMCSRGISQLFDQIVSSFKLKENSQLIKSTPTKLDFNTNVPESNQTDMKRYVNKKYLFTFLYPSNTNLMEQADDFLISSRSGSVKPLTLRIKEEQFDKPSNGIIFNQLNSIYPIIDLDLKTISLGKAKAQEYWAVCQVLDCRGYFIYFEHDNTRYELSYGAPYGDTANPNESLISTLLSSFEFINEEESPITTNWLIYADKTIQFKYSPNTAKEIKKLGLKPPSAETDLGTSFKEYRKYDPPTLVSEVSLVSNDYKVVTAPESDACAICTGFLVNISQFENEKSLTPEEWYQKYDYYPYVLSGSSSKYNIPNKLVKIGEHIYSTGIISSLYYTEGFLLTTDDKMLLVKATYMNENTREDNKKTVRGILSTIKL